MTESLPNIHQKVEEQLLIQEARRDIKAFDKLYQRYLSQVVRYLYSRLGNMGDAEDVAAQAFLAAYESFSSFKKEGFFAAWLFAIARNKAVDHLRRNRLFEQLDEVNLADPAVTPEKKLESSQESASISRLISALPDRDQELLRLRYVADLSFPEIAVLLHRRTDAVKKRTYRLLAKIRTQMEVGNE